MPSRLEELKKKRDELDAKFPPLTEKMKAAKAAGNTAEFDRLSEEARKLRGEREKADEAYAAEYRKENPKKEEKPQAPSAKTPERKETAQPSSTQVSAHDYPAIIYGLHKQVQALKERYAKAPEGERATLKKEIEQTEEARNRNLALAQRYYGANPEKAPSRFWNKKINSIIWPGQEGAPEGKQWDAFKPLTVSDLPSESLEWPKEFEGKDKFKKLMTSLPGGRAQDRFITHELKKTYGDLSKAEKELERWRKIPEDPRSKDKVAKLQKDVDSLRPYYNFLESMKGIQPSQTEGDYTYNDAYKQLVGSLTEEQKKDFDAGKEVTISPEQKKYLNDYNKEYQRRLKDLDRVQTYISASPKNTIAKWRSMDPEQRTDALEDARDTLRQEREAQGVLDYYENQTGKKESDFFNLPDDQRRGFLNAYRAQQAKESRARGEAPESSVWQTLFGRNESEFVSKYPPELRKPMSRAAKAGFSGLQNLVDVLQPTAQNLPLQQLYGTPQGGIPMEPYQPYIPMNGYQSPPMMNVRDALASLMPKEPTVEQKLAPLLPPATQPAPQPSESNQPARAPMQDFQALLNWMAEQYGENRKPISGTMSAPEANYNASIAPINPQGEQ